MWLSIQNTQSGTNVLYGNREKHSKVETPTEEEAHELAKEFADIFEKECGRYE